MTGLIKNDLMLVFSSTWEKIFLIFYIPLMLFVIEASQTEWLYFILISSYSYLLCITSFTYDVKGNTDRMINSLPVSRKEVVLCRYMELIIYFIFSIIYVGIYLWIINMLGLYNIGYFNISMIKIAFPTLLISTAVVFPFYLKFEPRIAQIAYMAVYMGIFLVASNSAGGNGLFSNLIVGKEISTTVIALIIWIISLILSIKLYENKDL